MRIGFDIDGVLANFDVAYERLFVELTGVNNFAPYRIEEGPVSWNWPTDHYGYTKEQTNEVWARIKRDPDFWFNLPTAPGFELFREWFLEQGNTVLNEVYFITARPGTCTKSQTEDWFRWHLGDIDIFPTVLISDQKGMVAKALNLDIYVDDRAENIADVVAKSPSTQAFLIDKAYNRHMNPGGVRVASFAEFMQVLDGRRVRA